MESESHTVRMPYRGRQNTDVGPLLCSGKSDPEGRTDDSEDPRYFRKEIFPRNGIRIYPACRSVRNRGHEYSPDIAVGIFDPGGEIAEKLTCRRDRHPASGTHEQGSSQHPLQFRHILAHGRLADTEAGGSLRETACLIDCHEHPYPEIFHLK